MKQQMKSLALYGTLIAAFAAPALADDAVKDSNKSNARLTKLEQRIEKQEKRIENGEKNGKLSPEKAQELKSKEAAIKSKLENESKDGLTKSEAREVNKELNAVGKEIRSDKHARK